AGWPPRAVSVFLSARGEPLRGRPLRVPPGLPAGAAAHHDAVGRLADGIATEPGPRRRAPPPAPSGD
ncbi:hypothetical protein, partial [Burkholderia gladioli]|uniref:hypothetical protein n=1 Tax=Burkholderia gladioli TaxID=28095 RepID=UPI001C232D39